MKAVSSFLKSSVSILNFLSRACWTVWDLSSSLYYFRVLSLPAIFALTYSGVSRLDRNSCSYYLSSAANTAASLPLRALRSVAALFFISAILSLIIFLVMIWSVLISHFAFNYKFLSPLIAFWRAASLPSSSLLAEMCASSLNFCETDIFCNFKN